MTAPGTAVTTEAERPLRIVVADDSYLVREALAHLLGDTPELELVATCEDGDALLAAVDAELPDAVLTDIRMPPSREDEGIAIANRLRGGEAGIADGFAEVTVSPTSSASPH